MQNVNDFFTGNEHHPLMRPTNKLEKPEWTTPDASMGVTFVLIRYGSRISYHLYDLKAGVFNLPPNKKEAVPKVMSEALIEPFNRWFLSLSKGSGTTRRNDCYTKCGGFDKLNHRNANLWDSPLFLFCITPKRIFKYRTICILYFCSIKIISHICIFRHFFKTFIK